MRPNLVGPLQAFRLVAQFSLEACQSAFPVPPVGLARAPFFRNEIEREISALAGGEVRYDSLAVRLFPQPHAAIRGVSVRVHAS